MRRVAIRIAYLGSNFHGSQIQPGKRTVEGQILKDIATISDLEPELKMAGRTDRGVNALGNVASFITDFDDDELMRALNAVSEDVFYLAIADVDDSFNPRHAVERVYRYSIDMDGWDMDAARECASMFIGTHDFKGFCKVDERSTMVDMKNVTIMKDHIEFRADHFLWNMIRRIVAAIEKTALGKTAIEDVANALDGKDISFGVAAPEGLTLCGITYEGVEFKTTDMYRKRLDAARYDAYAVYEFYDSMQ